MEVETSWQRSKHAIPEERKEEKEGRKNFLRIFMIITCWPALFCWSASD